MRACHAAVCAVLLLLAGACSDEVSGLPVNGTCQTNSDCADHVCHAGVCASPAPKKHGQACAGNGDCGVQQACTFSAADGYALCLGTGALGVSCDSGTQCVSTFCNGGVCSQCQLDADCDGGGTCVDDTDGVGWFVCAGGLGDSCAGADECNTGFCFDAGAAGSLCSLCAGNGDCAVQQECAFDGDLGYALCVGTGELGAACDDGSQCASGLCKRRPCSASEADAA